MNGVSGKIILILVVMIPTSHSIVGNDRVTVEDLENVQIGVNSGDKFKFRINEYISQSSRGNNPNEDGFKFKYLFDSYDTTTGICAGQQCGTSGEIFIAKNQEFTITVLNLTRYPPKLVYPEYDNLYYCDGSSFSFECMLFVKLETEDIKLWATNSLHSRAGHNVLITHTNWTALAEEVTPSEEVLEEKKDLSRNVDYKIQNLENEWRFDYEEIYDGSNPLYPNKELQSTSSLRYDKQTGVLIKSEFNYIEDNPDTEFYFQYKIVISQIGYDEVSNGIGLDSVLVNSILAVVIATLSVRQKKRGIP